MTIYAVTVIDFIRRYVPAILKTQVLYASTRTTLSTIGIAHVNILMCIYTSKLVGREPLLTMLEKSAPPTPTMTTDRGRLDARTMQSTVCFMSVMTPSYMGKEERPMSPQAR